MFEKSADKLDGRRGANAQRDQPAVNANFNIIDDHCVFRILHSDLVLSKQSAAYVKTRSCPRQPLRS